MLFSAVGSIGDRLDAKFITAHFFPAFVGVLGSIWILALAEGSERLADRAAQLDSVEQAIGVGIILLVTMMAAHMFSSLERPIASLYAGHALPAPVRDWAIRSQQEGRIRHRKASRLAGSQARLHPRDSAETQPTAFGNIVAATADYPRLAYAMDPFFWWPRLMPLLPADFQEVLLSTQIPMRGRLNLGVVFLYLAALAVVVLGIVAGQALTALLLAAIGIVLARLCYRAALVQATELARTIWVGVDLYRYELLARLHQEEPADLDAERAMWQRLAVRMDQLDEPLAAANSTGSTLAAEPASAPHAKHDSP